MGERNMKMIFTIVGFIVVGSWSLGVILGMGGANASDTNNRDGMAMLAGYLSAQPVIGGIVDSGFQFGLKINSK